MKDKEAVVAGKATGDETFNVDSFTLVGRDMAMEGGRGLVNDAGRVGDWCQTWTGARFYPQDPRPEEIHLLDVLMGLGNMNRYNGQCLPYTVAEHTVLTSFIVEDKFAWEALHHDDPEFLMSDVTRPFKRAIGRDNAYFKVEDNIWRKAIAPKFGLPEKLSQEVINADVALLGLEKEVLHGRSDPWDLPFPKPENVMIQCLPPVMSHEFWLRRYCDLSGEPFEGHWSAFKDLYNQDMKRLATHLRDKMGVFKALLNAVQEKKAA